MKRSILLWARYIVSLVLNPCFLYAIFDTQYAIRYTSDYSLMTKLIIGESVNWLIGELIYW